MKHLFKVGDVNWWMGRIEGEPRRGYILAQTRARVGGGVEGRVTQPANGGTWFDEQAKGWTDGAQALALALMEHASLKWGEWAPVEIVPCGEERDASVIVGGLTMGQNRYGRRVCGQG